MSLFQVVQRQVRPVGPQQCEHRWVERADLPPVVTPVTRLLSRSPQYGHGVRGGESCLPEAPCNSLNQAVPPRKP